MFFSTKWGCPTPPFLVHIWDSKNPWPLHNGEPGIDIHLSIKATWNNEHPQKYKSPFCRGGGVQEPWSTLKTLNVQNFILYWKLLIHMSKRFFPQTMPFFDAS